MKKSVIVCDKCHKEVEEKKSVYATLFVNTNGIATERCDICADCCHEIFNNNTDHPTEKGGVQE